MPCCLFAAAATIGTMLLWPVEPVVGTPTTTIIVLPVVVRATNHSGIIMLSPSLKTDDKTNERRHSVARPPVRLIIDTDLGSDVSNLISVCSANAMMDRGEADLLAVLTSTGQPAAIGAISAANHWYSHDRVQLGAYKGVLATDEVCTICRGPYIDDLVTNFSGPVQNYTQVPEAHVLYRKVLAAQPDGSVVIAAHGFLVNLQHLLNSSADEYSALTGVELVRKKVQKIAIMGGHYPRSFPVGAHHAAEWNFGGGCVKPPQFLGGCPWSSAASAYVTQHWPGEVPMVFSGYELGVQIHTGTRLLNGRDCPASVEANPCKAAFADFSAVTKRTWRESWDSVTSLFAVRGLQDFEIAQSGHNVVNATDGSDVWSMNATGVRQSYLILNETTGVGALQDAIDDLICAKPKAVKSDDLVTTDYELQRYY
jgi:hypothetical protein